METINSTFTLTLPESFQRLSEEEVLKAYTNIQGEVVAYRDEANHRFLSFLWKKSGRLLSRFTNLKSIAKRNEQLTAKLYSSYGYGFEDNEEKTIGGRQWIGYRYHYFLSGKEQKVLCLLYKEKSIVYSMNLYQSGENAADFAYFDELFSSLAYLN